jgi:carbohydrate kinase (thermoresistant glucokinase family)
MTISSPPVLIVMGVTGSGKSTIAEALGHRLQWLFQEGDALHSPENIRKMASGTPLTDEDRMPWIQAVKRWIDQRIAAFEPGLVSCSALKRIYRNELVAGRANVRLLYLKVAPTILRDRLAHRTGHFMPPGLLESQLQTLEEPLDDENPIILCANGTKADTVFEALAALNAVLGTREAAPAPSRPA